MPFQMLELLLERKVHLLIANMGTKLDLKVQAIFLVGVSLDP